MEDDRACVRRRVAWLTGDAVDVGPCEDGCVYVVRSNDYSLSCIFHVVFAFGGHGSRDMSRHQHPSREGSSLACARTRDTGLVSCVYTFFVCVFCVLFFMAVLIK